MSKLTSDDVDRVAALAHLSVDQESVEEFRTQLSRILDYVEQLDSVDLSGVEPLAHPFELVNAFREDEPTPMLEREQALQNAPKTDGQYFQVPQILDAK